jgi:hypothetical protein
MFRVFTVKEYEEAYGVTDNAPKDPQQKATSIGSLAWLMFSNRPLLCLGCSLEEDRTTVVLRALRERLPGLTHYAILAAPYSRSALEARIKNLINGCPALWLPGQFSKIEALLMEALERSSTRTVKHVASLDSSRALQESDAPLQLFHYAGRLENHQTAEFARLIGLRRLPLYKRLAFLECAMQTGNLR